MGNLLHNTDDDQIQLNSMEFNRNQLILTDINRFQLILTDITGDQQEDDWVV